MDLRRLSSRRSRRGISEVVGALLLMLVVVIAVGTFAYYLSNLQQQAETRNQFQVNVADEKLSVTNLAEFPSDINTQWQFILSTPSSTTPSASALFFVQLISTNPNEVTIYNGSDYLASGDFAFPSMPLTASLMDPTYPGPPYLGYYNEIANGVQACLDLAATPQPTITFVSTPCSPSGATVFDLTFQSAAIDNINMTVMNLNIQQSEISDIQLNNNWSQSWTELSQSGQILGSFSPNSLPVIVPAKESIILELNVVNVPIQRNSTLLITLLSTAGNYFTRTYSVIAPFLSSNTVDEQFGQSITSVTDFEASSPNSSAISDYLWRIDVPDSSWVPSDGWSDAATLETAFTYGQDIQLSGNLLLQYFTTPEVTAADLSQPIRVTLSALGTDGMVVQTASFIIPANSALGNPTGISITTSGSCGSSTSPGETITATLTNTLGVVAGSDPVTFTALAGNLAIGSSSSGGAGSFTIPASSGVARAVVVCSPSGSTGLVQVSALDVNPIQIAVS